TKLVLCFALIFTCLIALVCTATVAIEELRSMQDAIYEEDIPTMADLLQLSNNVGKLRASVQMLILIDDPTVKDREADQISTLAKASDAFIERLQGRFYEDAEALALFQNLKDELQSFKGKQFSKLLKEVAKSNSNDEKSELLRQRRGLFKELALLASS